MIVVCPLNKLNSVVTDHAPSHVVSLLGMTAEMPDLSRISDVQHLKLKFSDISTPHDGHLMPGEEHISALLEFVKKWDCVRPMVIHCWAGVSRSTAACYITKCTLEPDLDELELARHLRAASPSATPNARMIELADNLLDRKGRMCSAITHIGRGADAWEGNVFKLSSSR